MTLFDDHEDSDWKDLPEAVLKHCETLGYTKKLWDSDKEPKTCKKYFSDLTSSEQEAAKALGYTEESWDADSDSDSDSD